MQSAVLTSCNQVSDELEKLCSQYILPGQNDESMIQPLLVLKMKRTDLEVDMVPPVFTPTTNKWAIKSKCDCRNLSTHRPLVKD